jgi:hypothetical protein
MDKFAPWQIARNAAPGRLRFLFPSVELFVKNLDPGLQ